MTELTEKFGEKAAQKVNFRAMCQSRLGSGKFGDLYTTALKTGTGEPTDVLPYAAIIWDKDNDLFSIAFPHEGEHITHRLSVHFYHEDHEPLSDSGVFKPLSEVLEHLPQLKNKNVTMSERGGDRIINNLTHAQLETIIDCVTSLNHGLKQIADYRRQLDETIQLQTDNAFTNKPAEPTEPAPAAKQKPRRKQTKRMGDTP